jgi:hypothetical protein
MEAVLGDQGIIESAAPCNKTSPAAYDPILGYRLERILGIDRRFVISTFFAMVRCIPSATRFRAA